MREIGATSAIGSVIVSIDQVAFVAYGKSFVRQFEPHKFFRQYVLPYSWKVVVSDFDGASDGVVAHLSISQPYVT